MLKIWFEVSPLSAKMFSVRATMPISLRRLVLPASILVWSAMPALAEDWVIAKISGTAWISSPNAPVERATTGMAVPDGATFSTSQNARAQLNRGAESILVSPNTVISPQSYSFFGTSTTIQQQVGRIELEVDKRNVRQFTVKTPFLSAGVKGAHFTVSVSAGSADVQVARGLVEVSDVKSGASVEVRPGQKASVGGAEGRDLRVTAAGTESEARKNQAQKPADDEAAAGDGPSGGKSSTGNPGNTPGNTPGAAGNSANGTGKDNPGSGNAGNGNGGGNAGGNGAGGGNAGGNGNGGSNAGGNGNSGGNGNGNGRGGDHGGGSSGDNRSR